MGRTIFTLMSAAAILSLLSLQSCSDDKDSISVRIEKCIKEPETFSNDKGIALKLTQQEWYLKELAIGAEVSLKIAGSIQGDSIKVRTYGDGLINDVKLELDKNNKFNTELGISFGPKSVEEYINTRTNVFIFKGKDTLKVELKSCPIPNFHHK